MSGSYRRVSQDESGNAAENVEANITRSRGERLQNKLFARKEMNDTATTISPFL